jgi:hypothetical protein
MEVTSFFMLSDLHQAMKEICHKHTKGQLSVLPPFDRRRTGIATGTRRHSKNVESLNIESLNIEFCPDSYRDESLILQ